VPVCLRTRGSLPSENRSEGKQNEALLRSSAVTNSELTRQRRTFTHTWMSDTKGPGRRGKT
jgi:hypothetical protein